MNIYVKLQTRQQSSCQMRFFDLGTVDLSVGKSEVVVGCETKAIDMDKISRKLQIVSPVGF